VRGSQLLRLNRAGIVRHRPLSLSNTELHNSRPRAPGPMPTTIPAILDLFQDMLNPGKELLQTSC